MYRGDKTENAHDSKALLEGSFPSHAYADVPGLCKVATVQEVSSRAWSLNPGQYVGVDQIVEEEFDFKERLETLNEQLQELNSKARDAEERLTENMEKLLE
jgi:type I restriction enzyme M protein